MTIPRRHLLFGAGAAAVAACSRTASPPATSTTGPAERNWTMVTSWPADFPGLGTGARALADSIVRASGGRIAITVRGGNELVAPFEVFDAVGAGTAELGHSASYFWRAKAEAAPWFCTVPFGLNAQEMSAWLWSGGGLALWQELYAKSGLVPFPAGNTGVQTAGWSNREIATLGDLRGLKIRIAGLGAEVVARLGAVPVNVAGADIFEALKSGRLDASEWLGPLNDLAFGLFRVAKYCYFPGWQEPGPTIECLVNQKAWNELPDDLRAIVETCCRAANDAMLAEFTVGNARALATLRDEHGVQFRRLPAPVLAALRTESDVVLEAVAARDPFARRVHDAYLAFRDTVRAWHSVSEIPYYEAST
jgi:TRAP-type mannitol/chloroaromatic compound transport system substrate-binding protein